MYMYERMNERKGFIEKVKRDLFLYEKRDTVIKHHNGGLLFF